MVSSQWFHADDAAVECLASLKWRNTFHFSPLQPSRSLWGFYLLYTVYNYISTRSFVTVVKCRLSLVSFMKSLPVVSVIDIITNQFTATAWTVQVQYIQNRWMHKEMRMQNVGSFNDYLLRRTLCNIQGMKHSERVMVTFILVLKQLLFISTT